MVLVLALALSLVLTLALGGLSDAFPTVRLGSVHAMFEDELKDAKSQSSFMSQSKDTMKDYIESLFQPVEDWPRQRWWRWWWRGLHQQRRISSSNTCPMQHRLVDCDTTDE